METMKNIFLLPACFCFVPVENTSWNKKKTEQPEKPKAKLRTPCN